MTGTFAIVAATSSAEQEEDHGPAISAMPLRRSLQQKWRPVYTFNCAFGGTPRPTGGWLRCRRKRRRVGNRSSI